MKRMMFMVMLFLMPMVFADTVRTCLNNQSLEINGTTDLTVDGVLSVINTYKIENCTTECRNGSCVESNVSMSNFMVTASLGFIAISGICGFIAFKVDKDKHAFLQILFLGGSLGFMLLSVATMQRFLSGGTYRENIDDLIGAGYSTLVWGTVIFIIYFVLNFLFNALNFVGEKFKIGKNLSD